MKNYKAKKIGAVRYVSGTAYQDFEYRGYTYEIEYRNEWNTSAWSGPSYQHKYNQERIDKLIELESKSNQSSQIDWNEIWDMLNQ